MPSTGALPGTALPCAWERPTDVTASNPAPEPERINMSLRVAPRGLSLSCICVPTCVAQAHDVVAPLGQLPSSGT